MTFLLVRFPLLRGRATGAAARRRWCPAPPRRTGHCTAICTCVPTCAAARVPPFGRERIIADDPDAGAVRESCRASPLTWALRNTSASMPRNFGRRRDSETVIARRGGYDAGRRRSGDEAHQLVGRPAQLEGARSLQLLELGKRRPRGTRPPRQGTSGVSCTREYTRPAASSISGSTSRVNIAALTSFLTSLRQKTQLAIIAADHNELKRAALVQQGEIAC